MTTRSPLRIAASVALALAAGALATFMVLRPTTDYRIPLADLQTRIDAKMPVEGRKLGVGYTVTDVRLALVDEGKATLAATVALAGFERAVEFSATGTGVPSYRDGGFYLSNVTIDGAELLRLEEKHGVLGALGRFAGKLWEEGILSERQVDAAKAKASEFVHETLAAQLEARPVYSLDDGTVKGNVAKLALRDLKVDAAGVTVTLDPFGAVAKLALYGLVLILAAGAAIGVVVALLRPRSGGRGGGGGSIVGGIGDIGLGLLSD